MSDNLLIVAGEPSGDAIGGPLARELKKIKPNIELWGYGGEAMRGAGVEILTDVSELSFMGFIEVARHLPSMLKRFRRLEEEAIARRAVGAVLIDYPGFNLRLAKALKRAGIPVVYYVSPQIWAWKPERIETIRTSVKRMLSILPFEEEIYRKANIAATFVGHPFVDSVVPTIEAAEFRESFGLSSRVLLLLPGSREQEVKRLLPIMLEAFAILSADIPSLSSLVIRSPNLREDLFSEVKRYDNVKLSVGGAVEAMFASTAALCCSGSATLQCAIAGLPHTVVYKTGFLSASIYKKFIRTEFVGLSNLVAGYNVAPELLLGDCTPTKVAEVVRLWLTDPTKRDAKSVELSRVRELLGSSGVAVRAAEAVASEIFS